MNATELDRCLKSLFTVNEDTIDGILAGAPEREVTKVGTCWLPYLDTLKKMSNDGVNVVVCHERFIQLMDNVDLILLDYKATGDNNYIKLTGASNGEMLSNLNQAWLYHKPVIMRCPIIPGINDSEEHFAAIRNFKKQYDNIIRCEIMPYHTFGVGKWKQINADYSLGDVSAASNQQKILWNKKIDQ